MLSNAAVDGQRVVVVARPLANASARHYDFRPHLAGAATIDVIGARGKSEAFGYHDAHDVAKLLDTGLDREQLAVLIALVERGVNPEALAAVVRELRREAAALKSEEG